MDSTTEPAATATPAVTPAAGRAGYRPGYEVVAEQILELLVAEGLRPGDFLGTESRLAERLGTSRTVVREAVKTLAAVGRIRTQRGKGLYVVNRDGFAAEADFFLPADPDHVLMLFEFRRVQEEAVARLAAVRATPPEVRAIRQAATHNRAAARDGDLDGFRRTDTEFHTLLSEAAHNRFLVSAVRLARRLQHQSGLIGLRDTMAGSPRQAADEHVRIADAVAAGEPDAAAHAVGEHLDNTKQQYRQLLQEYLRRPMPDE